MHTETLKRTPRRQKPTPKASSGRAKPAVRVKMRRAIIQAAAKQGLVVVTAPSPRNSALKRSLRRSLKEALDHNTKPIAELWSD